MERLDIVCQNGEMTVGEKAMQALKEAYMLEVKAKEIQKQADSIKKQFADAMEQNGVMNFKCDSVSIAYIPESTRTTVDTAKMKAEGVYKYYLKETPTKASCRWTWKREKNNGTDKK